MIDKWVKIGITDVNVSALLRENERLRSAICADYEHCNELPRTPHGLAVLLDGKTPDELRTLRAIINGKLSKRTITKEQQERMQQGRVKKKEPAPS